MAWLERKEPHAVGVNTDTVGIVDITDLTELHRLAEEVRATRQMRLLRAEDEDVALLVPVGSMDARSEHRRTPEEFDAVMSAAGGWRGIVDTEQLKADIKSARGSDRPEAMATVTSNGALRSKTSWQ